MKCIAVLGVMHFRRNEFGNFAACRPQTSCHSHVLVPPILKETGSSAAEPQSLTSQMIPQRQQC